MKSRKGQLVCEHLENISLDALEKHQEALASGDNEKWNLFLAEQKAGFSARGIQKSRQALGLAK